MKDLPPLLAAIPNLRQALYADDLTLSIPTGCPGAHQDALQEAIDVTQTYLRARGLECAPEKFTLLTLCARTYKRRTDPIPDPELTVNNLAVPTVPHHRILGLSIPKNGSGSQTLPALKRTLTQLTLLVQRIAHRRYRSSGKGHSQNNASNTDQSSKLRHTIPGSQIRRKEKLNTFIRQAYKLALGLHPSTFSRKLLQLGVHNTLEELHEAIVPK